MNTSNPIGELRTNPAFCDIGDWVNAADVPEWENDFCHDRPFPGDDHQDGMKIFKLFPYVDGKRQLVWIRIG